MLIVAGHRVVHPEERDAYVAGCAPAVEAARSASGCEDFAISADPLEPGHVRIFERWTDEASLLAFRGSGPSGEQRAQLLDVAVRRYEVAGEGPP